MKKVFLFVLISALCGCAKKEYEGFFISETFYNVPITTGPSQKTGLIIGYLINCEYIVRIKDDSLTIYRKTLYDNSINNNENYLTIREVKHFKCNFDKGAFDKIVLSANGTELDDSREKITATYESLTDGWVFKSGLLANVKIDESDNTFKSPLKPKIKQRDVYLTRVSDSIVNLAISKFQNKQ